MLASEKSPETRRRVFADLVALADFAAQEKIGLTIVGNAGANIITGGLGNEALLTWLIAVVPLTSLATTSNSITV